MSFMGSSCDRQQLGQELHIFQDSQSLRHVYDLLSVLSSYLRQIKMTKLNIQLISEHCYTLACCKPDSGDEYRYNWSL